jgi:hypothetical protein
LSGSASATTRNFSLTIGTLNFYVNDVGIGRLLPTIEIATSAVYSMSPPPDIIQETHVVDSTSSSPAMYLGVCPASESSPLSIGSNILRETPSSPATAYCPDYDAYHFMGTADFSSHEISGRGAHATALPRST